MSKQKIQLKKDNERELGFGGSTATQRQMNRDGSSNVQRINVHRFSPINIYHYLVTISWTRFNIYVLSSYLAVNFFFACIYYFIIGVEQLGGMGMESEWRKFAESFFFSAQTITTVGYGHISPKGLEASAVAAMESLFGLLSFALATGLLYGRFSRPTAKILFSNNALITPFKQGKALMFKLVNARPNTLIEAEINVIFAYDDIFAEKPVRRFQNLKLDISRISFLVLSWTLVHPIDEESPLHDITEEDLKRMNAEVFILLKAIDDAYATQVYTRTSYRSADVVWNAKFRNIIEPSSAGKLTIDVDRIHEYDLLN